AVDDPEAMMRGVFERIRDHLGVDTFFNFTMNEAGNALTLVSCAGIPEDAFGSISQFEFGQALCGGVAEKRRPISASHIQASDDPGMQVVKSFGIRAYACNPLMAG